MTQSTDDLVKRLFEAQVGGCECLTKTPEIQYHDRLCKFRLCSESLGTIERLQRELAARDKTIKALVLDADARIGSTIFRKGVSWATVIKRAQREFEYQQNPVKPMTDAERDAFWKAMEPDAARSEEKP